MTVILALNPSIDLEWQVNDVRWEEKNTIESERRWAGGKGVNVARWLQHLGGEGRLLLPLGGPTGKELAGFLHQEKLATRIIPLRQPTRVNVIVTTAGRGQLRFNPKGPQLTRPEWQAVLDAVKSELSRPSARSAGLRPGALTIERTAPGRRPALRSRASDETRLVLSGGLPRGVPANAYAQLLHLAAQANARSFLDCDGAALALAIKAKPFLVKPNVPELAQWWGQPLTSLTKIKFAARALSDVTHGWVLVSRGQHGALLIHSRGRCELSASAPKANVLNTVGAGDAMLAGVIRQVESQSPPEEWLRWGVAVGTAATQCAAGELPRLAVIQKLARQVAFPTAR